MKIQKSELLKHVRVWLQFARVSVMRQLEYRANFFISLAVETCFLLSKLMYVLIVVQTGGTADQVSADEMVLYVGTFMLMTALYTGFFMDNFYAISGKVRQGSLDLDMVKPISLQFMTTARTVNIILPIPNVLCGVTMVCVSWNRLGLPVTLGSVLFYLLLLALGLMLAYSLFLMPMLLSFRIVSTQALVEITDKLWDFNSVPMRVYPLWMQRIGMFVIPVFAITNFPMLSAMRAMNAWQTAFALFAPILFFVLVRLCWKSAIKKYASAGG